jgi:hypothetical protein
MVAPKLAKVEIQPLLLSYTDAAKVLGLATQTLRNGISKGRFKGLQPCYLAGKPLFRFADLQKFAAALPEQPGLSETKSEERKKQAKVGKTFKKGGDEERDRAGTRL